MEIHERNRYDTASHLYGNHRGVRPANRGEIVAELVRGGAKAVNMDYREGKVSGLRWMMPVGGRDVLFDMPVRIEPVFKMLEARAKRPRADFRRTPREMRSGLPGGNCFAGAGPERHD